MVAKRLRRISVEKGMYGIAADPPPLNYFDESGDMDETMWRLIYRNALDGKPFDTDSYRTDMDLKREGFSW